MGKSTVYFTDFRCPVGTSQLDKLKKVCLAAGIKNIDMDGKFVAIKMHFGELGNLAFLRPNYAKAVADSGSTGWRSVLTDCNTLSRQPQNALEHLTVQKSALIPSQQAVDFDRRRSAGYGRGRIPFKCRVLSRTKDQCAIMDADILSA
ncbi:MAG: hypothetical protein ACLURV_08670 [Gallintestinimicrobium sp.]